MFESFKTKRSVERIIDEKFYEEVALEIDSGVIKPGLWAKATANSDGKETKIKALYIQYRVQALVDNDRIAGINGKNTAIDDSVLYGYVGNQVEQGVKDNNFWVKALSEVDGDNDKVNSVYIKHQIKYLKSRFEECDTDYSKLTLEEIENIVQNDFEILLVEYKKRENKKLANQALKDSKFGGFLSFTAFIVIISAVMLTLKLIVHSFTIPFTIDNTILTGWQTLVYMTDIKISYDNFNRLFNLELFNVAISLFLAICFMTKTKYIKSVVALYLMLRLTYVGAEVYFGKTISDSNDFDILDFYNPAIEIFALVFWSIIQMLYILFSKRVKKVFTNESFAAPFVITAIFLIITNISHQNYKANTLIPKVKESLEYKVSEGELSSVGGMLSDLKTFGLSEQSFADYLEEVAEKNYDEKKYEVSKLFYLKVVENGDKSALFRLAYSYNELKEYDLAIENYVGYIATEPEYHGTYSNLGSVFHYGKKDYKQAIDWYKKAVKKGGKDFEFQIAYSYHELERYKIALSWYEKTPKDASAAWNSAIIYENGLGNIEKDLDKALELYLKAEELGSEKAKEKVKMLRVAKAIKVNKAAEIKRKLIAKNRQEKQRADQLNRKKADEVKNKEKADLLVAQAKDALIDMKYELSFSLMLKAAHLGSSFAAVEVEYAYRKGVWGASKNAKEAKYWQNEIYLDKQEFK